MLVRVCMGGARPFVYDGGIMPDEDDTSLSRCGVDAGDDILEED